MWIPYMEVAKHQADIHLTASRKSMNQAAHAVQHAAKAAAVEKRAKRNKSQLNQFATAFIDSRSDSYIAEDNRGYHEAEYCD